jgi:transposase
MSHISLKNSECGRLIEAARVLGYRVTVTRRGVTRVDRINGAAGGTASQEVIVGLLAVLNRLLEHGAETERTVRRVEKRGRRPKMTDTQARQALVRLADGELDTAVAHSLGVSRATLYRALHRVRVLRRQRAAYTAASDAKAEVLARRRALESAALRQAADSAGHWWAESPAAGSAGNGGTTQTT